MTSLSLAIALSAGIASTGAESYAEAHRETTETGRPLVVMVGADWCPACNHMKQQVLPQVRRRGVLGKVAFAVVDLDQQRELGQQLIRGGPIPQLLMFRRTAAGWRLRRLIGGQTPQTVERFIDEGLRAEEQIKQVQAAPAPAPPAQAPPQTQAAAQPAEQPTP